MSLRSGSGGARNDPSGPKTAPRAARSEPRVRPKSLFLLFLLPGRLREASGSDSGGILGAPGTILERFWDDCGLDFKTD